MSQQQVGKAPFTINKIVKIMKTATTYANFQTNWTGFARELELPESLINDLGRDKLLDKINFEDLLVKLLNGWIKEAGSDATIDVFYDALKECKFKDISETLQDGFKEISGKDGKAPQVSDFAELSSPCSLLSITFRGGSDANIVMNEVERKLREYASPAVVENINSIILKARSCLDLDDAVNSLLHEEPKKKVSGLFEIIRSKQTLEPNEDKVFKDFLLMLINDDNKTIAKSMETIITSKGAIIVRK